VTPLRWRKILATLFKRTTSVLRHRRHRLSTDGSWRSDPSDSAPSGIIHVNRPTSDRRSRTGFKIADAKPSTEETGEEIKEEKKKKAKVLVLDVLDITFPEPNSPDASHASISVLDPVITIERHNGKYHLAARFNIKRTILDYHLKTRSENYLLRGLC
jgi:hypothetical protein